ncbi:MAG: EH signature domain-containing protein [bacterium]
MTAVQSGYNHLSTAFDSRRKVRKLSWSLNVNSEGRIPIIQTKYLPEALRLIEGSSRPSMLLGVVDCLLEWWISLQESYRSDMMKLIETKLSSFSGKNPKLTKLREMAPYFTRATGPAGLAADLIKEDRQLSEVWGLFEFADSMRRYRYFSEVALQYIQVSRRLNRLSNEIPAIMDFLRSHTENVKGVQISKKIISILVEWMDKTSSLDHKQLLKEKAFNLIGDPKWEDRWSPWPGITDSEESTLRKARKTLKEWLAVEIFGIFFENRSLGMDKRRKNFWLRYCRHVDEFKLYTNRTVLSSLSDDDRVKPYAPTRLGRLTGGGNQLSALVFTIKGYVLVEFSAIGGAFYAYTSEGLICPDTSRHTMKISDLRRGVDVDHLINHTTGRFSPEGRFFHNGNDWEYRLSHWISRYLGI